MVMPQFLLPPAVPALAAHEPTLDAELERLEANWAASPVSIASGGRALPRLAMELADGSPRAMSHLIEAIRALFTTSLADDWPGIRSLLHSDLTFRVQQMLAGGPAHVLSTLHPGLDWKDDKLIVAGPPLPATFTDAAGGLTLMPCAFGSSGLHPLVPGGNRRVIVYSARLHFGPQGNGDTLSTLIGAGRARTLRALTTPCSTTVLAARLVVTAPTASAHAGVLRRAGLITTRREGQQVWHELTPTGAAFLAANPLPGAISRQRVSQRSRR